eukprot:CAMPEP_0170076220 /NCGR_PEP_ID=MMETSP0019_2-20121128/13227_1 /TAXON_ID=98059 /ORGANISM="Dinobryon sp., Strain UTEXLB2267" /LENGTH=234 /DNA_ID=CAMNT_0010287711 /DNA_START=670 /DNA_END=1374 /DNA_ORIENTATION=+
MECISNRLNPIEGIVFDEASKYFTKESLSLLDCLTSWTKEQRSLAVIMATSDYGFPFALHNIGYNRNHISESLVLSDVSPKETLHLLQRWGVRSNLAYLLVELYGGHILQICHALEDLYNTGEETRIRSSFISGLDSQLVTCAIRSKLEGISREVKNALDTLMETGFYPCNFEDPVADLVTKCNIAGFIDTEAQVPGLSYKLRAEKTGLVPSTQMIRIVYALKAKELDELFGVI